MPGFALEAHGPRLPPERIEYGTVNENAESVSRQRKIAKKKTPRAGKRASDIGRKRCAWAGDDPAYIRYHDEEWGVPVHDDRTLFEFLILEGAQAGLSWITILRKRDAYRAAFDNFDPKRVARYDRRRIARLLRDPGIVRNRLKIESTVTNARAFIEVQREFGRFADYLWRFVGGRPRINRWRSLKQVPSRTRESDALSDDLRRRGFRFVGSTICYAYMQAVGLVSDHTASCFLRRRPRSRARR